MTKNDRIIQARCSSVALATIAKALTLDGVLVTNTSQLVRTALNWLEDIIKENRDDVKIQSLAEAIEVLDNLGMDKKPGKYKYQRLPTIGDKAQGPLDWEDLSKEDIEKLVREELEKNKS